MIYKHRDGTSVNLDGTHSCTSLVKEQVQRGETIKQPKKENNDSELTSKQTQATRQKQQWHKQTEWEKNLDYNTWNVMT